jgi:hypothetical protein
LREQLEENRRRPSYNNGGCLTVINDQIVGESVASSDMAVALAIQNTRRSAWNPMTHTSRKKKPWRT